MQAGNSTNSEKALTGCADVLADAPHVGMISHVLAVILYHPGEVVLALLAVRWIVLVRGRVFVREEYWPTAAIQRVAHHAKSVQRVRIEIVA